MDAAVMSSPYATTFPTRGPQLVCDDVLQWAETSTGQPFQAMLCDPPYELSFMSRKWDSTGIAFRPGWATLASHLLPGAFIMAFASSRGAGIA